MSDTCPRCIAARAGAKAAGHRGGGKGVCFDHAGVNIDEYFASIGYVPEAKVVAGELAAAAPTQPDLFGRGA